MHQEKPFLHPPAPVWTPAPMPGRVPDAGTPIYDALVRTWQRQGRQLPQQRDGDGWSGAGRPLLLRPQPGAGSRSTGWWAGPTGSD